MPFSSGSGFLPLPPVGVNGPTGAGFGYAVSPGRPWRTGGQVKVGGWVRAVVVVYVTVAVIVRRLCCWVSRLM